MIGISDFYLFPFHKYTKPNQVRAEDKVTENGFEIIPFKIKLKEFFTRFLNVIVQWYGTNYKEINRNKQEQISFLKRIELKVLQQVSQLWHTRIYRTKSIFA